MLLVINLTEQDVKSSDVIVTKLFGQREGFSGKIDYSGEATEKNNASKKNLKELSLPLLSLLILSTLCLRCLRWLIFRSKIECLLTPARSSVLVRRFLIKACVLVGFIEQLDGMTDA